MKIKDILDIFYPNGLDRPYNKNVLRKQPELKQILIKKTDFLKKEATISERLYVLRHNICVSPICLECGSPVKFKSPKEGYAKFCSKKCTSKSSITKIKRNNTFNEKYGGIGFGSKEILDKVYETNLDRFGTSIPQQTNIIKDKIKNSWKDLDKEIILKKRRETNLEKYGTEYHQQNSDQKEKLLKSMIKNNGGIGLSSDKIKSKVKATMQKKYGVDNPMQSDKIKSKVKATMQKKYGVDNYKELDNDAWNNFKKYFDPETFQLDLSLQEMEEKYQVRYYTISNFLQKYGFEFSKISSYEQSLRNILPDDFEFNNRTILDGRELDFYSKSRNLAIEFNGLLYHSEKYGKDKNYHKSKTDGCISKDISLIHIFENEWLFKRNIVESIINTKLNNFSHRIYARKCQIKELDTKIKNDFLEENHIQGKDSSKVKLGLFYEGDLVQVMTFGHSRFNKKYQYEMHRSCSRIGYQIIGGLNKLWSYFIKNYKPKSVVTYADRRYFDGRSYLKLGFNFSHTSPSNFWIFGPGIKGVDSRLNWQKHKQKDKLKKFDPTLTAWENMIDNGYNRIWDSGNNVYIWKAEE